MPAAPAPAKTRPTARPTARSTTASSTRAVPSDPDDREHLNEVRLRGRLAAASIERPLPSGDVIATFRLLVERPVARKSAVTRARVDTLDCVVHRAEARRRVARWAAGDVVEVVGSLHRRFFRAGGSTASRYEVEATALTRVARAGAAERATMAG